MHQSAHFLILFSITAGALLSACDGGTEGAPRALLVDLDGVVVDPLTDSKAKAVVLLFARSDCPISNRYAPEVKRLYAEFAPRGVAFWLVYPVARDTSEVIRKHVQAYEYPLRVARDPGHAWVRKTGVKVTPEAAVFRPGGQLAYRGRIDDWYVDFGKARSKPEERDLQNALTAILEGKPVPRSRTGAVGCFISEL